jgi:hypothetical protein
LIRNIQGHDRTIQNLMRTATALGYKLLPTTASTPHEALG